MPNPAELVAHHWGLAVFLLGIVGLLAFMLGVSSLFGSETFGRSKNELFEFRTVPAGGARLCSPAKFYPVAVLFVIFDVEALFLLTWPAPIRENGRAGLIETTIFIVILLVGPVYLQRTGVLDWASKSRRKRQTKLKQ